MYKAIIQLKILFYLSILILVFFSFFPGNFFGHLIYGDIKKTPYIISYSFETTFMHFSYYLYLSCLGFYVYFNTSYYFKIFLLLLSLSFFLEIFQIFIPNRSFQFYDLCSNIAGVLIASFIFKFFAK